MLKRFDLKDFIHFAYLAVIALVLASVMAILINTSIELLNDGLNQAYQKTAFDYYVYLFSISFIYLVVSHPQEKPKRQEEPQDLNFFSLNEEVEMVYLLVNMLGATFLHPNSEKSINDYLETYLSDDTLFMEMGTTDILAMLRQALNSSRLSVTNRELANKRVDLMIKELIAVNRLGDKDL